MSLCCCSKASVKSTKFFVIAIGLACCALPLGAQDFYQQAVVANAYASLPSPTIITTDVDDGQVNVTPPFSINFYENSYAGISLGYNGAILFPNGQSVSLGNAVPGSAAAPNNWIAPFWDDLRLYAANGGYIGYQTQGTSPNRTFSVEWQNISRFGTTGVTLSMQVRFFEGSPRIEVDYGPIAGTASFSSTMAMEDINGAREELFSASGCTTNCSATNYQALQNMRIILDVAQADLAIDKTADSSQVPSGQTVTYTIVVTNGGPDDANGVTVSDVIPPGLSNASWTCASSAGSICTANGLGDINDSVTILAGGNVTYTLQATVEPVTNPINNTATVTAPVGVIDSTPGNDSSSVLVDALIVQVDMLDSGGLAIFVVMMIAAGVIVLRFRST